MTNTEITVRSAKIENGIVTNIIEGTLPGFIECPETVGIGWLYTGQKGFYQTQPPLAERKAAMVTRIKTEAYSRIEAAMPTWKVIRSLTSGPAVGTDTQAEAQRLRAVSNTLENQVNAMNAEALDSFDPGDDQHWSALSPDQDTPAT